MLRYKSGIYQIAETKSGRSKGNRKFVKFPETPPTVVFISQFLDNRFGKQPAKAKGIKKDSLSKKAVKRRRTFFSNYFLLLKQNLVIRL